MVITVFGLGFVGLTTALGFAEKNNVVYGYEINEERKRIISKGQIPFLEPGLDTALTKHLNKNFFISNDLKDSISQSNLIFFCVGTPYGDNGEADLSFLYSAIDQTLPNLNKNNFTTLVIKSTVPPHTAIYKVIPYIESKGFKVGHDLGLANNPEFLREGYCWDDFMNPDRIVLGINDNSSKNLLFKLYESFNAPIFFVNNSTSEFIKYLSNTLLATMISFSNEMSIIATLLKDVNIKDSFNILHLDKRWVNGSMKSYVYPGAGYGGYCLPKDTNAFFALSKNLGYTSPILSNVIKTNDNMPDFISNHIINNLKDKSSKIGILGLSFKPNSDDVRDSPSAKIIEKLNSKGFMNIIGYDPVSNDEFKKHYNFDSFAFNIDDLINKSDLVVVLTAWKDFKDIKNYTDKPILDFRYFI